MSLFVRRRVLRLFMNIPSTPRPSRRGSLWRFCIRSARRRSKISLRSACFPGRGSRSRFGELPRCRSVHPAYSHTRSTGWLRHRGRSRLLNTLATSPRGRLSTTEALHPRRCPSNTRSRSEETHRRNSRFDPPRHRCWICHRCNMVVK